MGFLSGELLSDRLEINPRRSGFDLLRIVLAYTIVAWHTIVVCFGSAAEEPLWFTPLRPFLYFIVPSFFALSGFLVAGSMERNDALAFAWNRFIRIFPALSFEVVLSAIALGLAFSTLSLHDYVTNSEFRQYFLNVVGSITYHLPGVFQNHPDTMVNKQLWTIPIELEVYIGLMLLWPLRVFSVPRVLLVAFVAISMAYAAHAAISGPFLPSASRPSNGLVIASFFMGVTLYCLRSSIILSPAWFCAGVVCSIVLLYFEGTKYLAVLPLAYVTIWIGTRDISWGFIRKAADYSYGVYLFGYPMQQTAFELFPMARSPIGNFVVASVLATSMAAISWHFIERPLLRNRVAMFSRLGRTIASLEMLSLLGRREGQGNRAEMREFTSVRE